jgi:hypothetical protein
VQVVQLMNVRHFTRDRPARRVYVGWLTLWYSDVLTQSVNAVAVARWLVYVICYCLHPASHVFPIVAAMFLHTCIHTQLGLQQPRPACILGHTEFMWDWHGMSTKRPNCTPDVKPSLGMFLCSFCTINSFVADILCLYGEDASSLVSSGELIATHCGC